MTSYSKAHANIAYQYKQEINKSDLDSRQHRNEFVTASGGFEDFNRMLANGFISNVNVVASNNTALQHILFYSKDKTKGVLDLTYLLTCHPPADINGSTPHRSWRPLHTAAYTNNPAAVKLFIDFNGDRDIVNGSNETAFDFAKKYNFQEVMKLLKDYLPSEE
jgi:ankyrin repeat protein